jgi:hypothetical protein
MSASKPDTTSGSGRRAGSEARGEVRANNPTAAILAAWLVPGGGHFVVGSTRKALVFFLVLMAMDVVGLALGGRLFPLQTSEPLVFLSAVAQWAVGLPRLAALVGGLGAGNVIADTYEYGNTFLIVAGLLNTLLMLDTYDIAAGRKPR